MANIPNEALISALLSHTSIKAAAEEIGLTEKAVYSRMKTPEFKELYAQAREEMLHTATARLQNSANSAISALEQIMADESTAAQTKVNAATAILQYCLKFSECTDLKSQVEVLNDRLDDALSLSLKELADSLESDSN